MAGTAEAEGDIGALDFEGAMAELERVVNRLDSGDVPLAESIRLYARGAALRARCDAMLREAEEQVEQITLDAKGRPAGLRPADEA